MAKTKKSQPAAAAAPAPDAAASPAENVRAAFDRYRQEMKGKAKCAEGKIGASPSAAGMFAYQPFPGQATVPMPLMPGSPAPAAPAGSSTAQPPLFESVGQMLRLGVSLANAVFASGLQVMQGFNGPEMAPGPWGGECRPHGMWGCGPVGECGCHAHSCGCHPGVHNCGC